MVITYKLKSLQVKLGDQFDSISPCDSAKVGLAKVIQKLLPHTLDLIGKSNPTDKNFVFIFRS